MQSITGISRRKGHQLDVDIGTTYRCLIGIGHIPLNGDRIVENGVSLGRLNGQTLFLFDAAAGYWIYQRPGAYLVKGVSAQVEFHYMTALQDPEFVSGSAMAYNSGLGRLGHWRGGVSCSCKSCRVSDWRQYR